MADIKSIQKISKSIAHKECYKKVNPLSIKKILHVLLILDNVKKRLTENISHRVGSRIHCFKSIFPEGSLSIAELQLLFPHNQIKTKCKLDWNTFLKQKV